MTICKHCKTEISNDIIATHSRWCAKNPNRKIKKEKVCPTCKNLHNKRGTYCGSSCISVSEETKEKISKGRKKYLIENPEKHPWKIKTKQNSIPCEKVKQFLLSNNISFVEEWQPLETRFFSIDIAFPDIKVGLEINGNQHYDKNGDLKEYYQKRHDLIVADGWTLLELHYSIANNLEQLMDIIKIKNQPDYSEYFKIKELRNEQKPKALSSTEKAKLKWEPFVEMITSSNIDFTKFGWVNEVSNILQLSPQKISKWMKTYMPNFYEKECFKRKSK